MSNLMAINGNIVGGLPIASENLKLLWENPNPTLSFAAQNITLSSGDYDFLLWNYRATSNDTYIISSISPKGANTVLSMGRSFAQVQGALCYERPITRSSDTSFSVGAGSYSLGASAAVEANTVCIPTAIYGIYKKSIANTEASKCMLSDGVTSVEDAITSTSTYQATAASGYTLAVNRIETRSGWCAATLIFSNVTLAAGSAWVKVATTPIKPAYDVFESVYDGNNVRIIGESRIDSNGNVYVCLSTAASNIYLSIYLTFIVA